MTTHEPDTLVWRKSSFSAETGNCVEVGWRTSTYSAGQGNCIEVAPTRATFLVRDSKNPAGPALVVSTPHWRRFLNTLPH